MKARVKIKVRSENKWQK